mgnify:FL=1
MEPVIVIDLDNTLLKSDKTISDYSVNVLKKCQMLGAKIVYSTARSLQASRELLKKFSPDAYVGYGGALIITPQKEILRFEIPNKTSKKIIDECFQSRDVAGVYAVNEYISLYNGVKPIDSYYQYSDCLCDYNQRFLKISILVNDINWIKNFAVRFPMCNVVWYDNESIFSILDYNATKWNSVKLITEYCNRDINSVIAFGDDYNDIEMIKNCGVGVAVKNAISEVKTVADYICKSNDEDGVARWLEKYIL